MHLLKIVIDRANSSTRCCARIESNNKETYIRIPSVLHLNQELDREPMVIDGQKWSVGKGVISLPLEDAIVPAARGAKGKIENIVPVLCGVLEELYQTGFLTDDYVRISQLVFLNPMVTNSKEYLKQLTNGDGTPKMIEAVRGGRKFSFKLAPKPKVTVYKEARIVLEENLNVLGVYDMGDGTRFGLIRGYRDQIQSIVTEDKGIREIIKVLIDDPKFGDALLASGLKSAPPADVVIDRLARGFTSVKRGDKEYDFKSALTPLVRKWFNQTVTPSLLLMVNAIRDAHPDLQPNGQIQLIGGGAALIKTLLGGQLPVKIKLWVSIPEAPEYAGVRAAMRLISSVRVELEGVDSCDAEQEVA